MGIIGLVLSLFGAGAAVAKSEHDAQQKMHSQYVREIDAERRYLDQGRSLLGDRKFNRVMEFDLCHAKAREILAQLDPDRLYKWEMLGLAAAYLRRADDREKFRYECCERPSYSNWDFRWHIDIAEKNGYFEWLDSIGFTHEIIPQNTRKEKARYVVALRSGRDKAMDEWFKQAHPEFKGRGITRPFGCHDYIREYARKTVLDNGYLPSSYRRAMRGHNGYTSLYDGQYLPSSLGNDFVDYWFGIPDQEKRAELIKKDEEYP